MFFKESQHKQLPEELQTFANIMRSIRHSFLFTILCSLLFSYKKVFGKFDDILLKIEEERLKKGYCQKINRRPKIYNHGTSWKNFPSNNDLCLDYCERTDKVENADIVYGTCAMN